jgi:hypothetical protein
MSFMFPHFGGRGYFSTFAGYFLEFRRSYPVARAGFGGEWVTR